MRLLLAFIVAAYAVSVASDAAARQTDGYAYDAQGRLIAADHAGAVHADVDTDYTYDAANNRTSRTVTGVSSAMRSAEQELIPPPGDAVYRPEDEPPVAASVLGPSRPYVPPYTPPPPTAEMLSQVDERGVGVFDGGFNYATTDVVIGPQGGGALTYARSYHSSPADGDGGWRDNLTGTLQVSGSTYYVSIGGRSQTFMLSGGVYTPTQNTGATLTYAAGLYTWTASDGTVAVFDQAYDGDASPYEANRGLVTSIRAPNGLTQTFHYRTVTVDATNPTAPDITAVRLSGVTNNVGYMIKLEYEANTASTQADLTEWWEVNRAIGVNLGVEYCNVQAVACTGLTGDWPSATYEDTTVVDELGRQTVYGYAGALLTTVQMPGDTSPSLTLTYSGVSPRRVTSVAIGADVWAYDYATVGGLSTTTVTDPLANETVVVANPAGVLVASSTNPLGQTTAFQYDSQGRLTRVTYPEGNRVEYTLNTRGNLTQTTVFSKSGTSRLDTYASFAACTSPVTCSFPISTTDANGNVTNYIYNATHGGLTSIREPAPSSGAARPQTRVGYSTKYARYLNASGAIVTQTDGVTLPVSISQCITGEVCDDTAQEQRTVVVYGSSDVALANNLLPTRVTNEAGDESLQSINQITYTPAGDVASVNGPLSGLGDTTWFNYDAGRQLTDVASPDPDGAGPLLRAATHYIYHPSGQPERIATGTVAGGDAVPVWSTFAQSQAVATSYNLLDRPTSQSFVAGASTVYAYQQWNYDALGRMNCNAVRMNPATFSSPPQACILATAGAYGPDRISQTAYDAAGRVTTVTTGLGTTAAVTETATYTANGQVATLADGRGSLSSLFYNGFDRYVQIRYPLPTVGAGSNVNDRVTYIYDSNGNVTQETRRSGAVFTYAYDHLNRLTAVNAPTGTPDQAFTYNNLGWTLTGTQSGATTSFGYDALGRQTSQTSALGTFSSVYDASGQRTRLNWPDSFFAIYIRNKLGAITEIRENGATSGLGLLAVYGYDSLGRRTSVTRSNGADTSYGYDGASRLTSLAHDLPGAGQDQAYGFTYNPVGQIYQRTSSNDLFAYDGYANGADAYVNNGLNQVTAAAGSAVTWDTGGNLANDGTRAFSYDAADRLTQAGSTGMTYDAFDRMSQLSTIRFGWVGTEVVSEHDTSNVLTRRNVPGPWQDEVAAYYLDETTTGRRWPLTDQLGSVVSYSLPDGTLGSVNAYDEYGVGAAGNTGRFGYTGQMTFAGIGLSYYKARFYNPELGRFLQTDPIGYAAGANLYAYVGGDPMNFIDPRGLYQTCVPTTDAPCVDEVVVTGHRGDRCGWLCRTSRFVFGTVERPTPIRLGTEWLTGKGPASRVIGPDNPMTEELATAPDIEDARCSLYSKYGGNYAEGDSYTNVAAHYGVDDYLTANTLTEQYVGGYSIDAYVAGGNAVYIVTNTSSVTSALGGSILPSYMQPPNWERSSIGLAGNTRQTFWWSEPLPEGC